MNQIVQSLPRTGINEGRHLADNKKENLTGFGSKAVHSEPPRICSKHPNIPIIDLQTN